MFFKILKKLKTKDKVDNKKLALAIRKMNITDMRQYINNKTLGLSVSEAGLIEVLNRLILKNNNRYYINENDDDTKIKKCFELVLSILRNPKTTSNVVELVIEFIDIFEDIIKKYDHDNKDIYSSKFLNSIANALTKISCKTDIEIEVNLVNNT